MLASIPDDAFLYIPSDIYAYILGMCVGCDIEISGMGQLVPFKGGYLVTKVHTGIQECTSSETELCDKWLGKLESDVLLGKHGEGELSWWWHSHVDMNVFWSGTDMKAIRQMSKTDGRIVSTVFNRDREMRTSYSQGPSKDGYYARVFQDELDTVIIPTDAILEEIQLKVSRPKPTSVPPVPVTPTYEKYNIVGDEIVDEQVSIVQSLVFYYSVEPRLAESMYDLYCNMTGHAPETADECYEVYNTYTQAMNSIT